MIIVYRNLPRDFRRVPSSTELPILLSQEVEPLHEHNPMQAPLEAQRIVHRITNGLFESLRRHALTMKKRCVYFIAYKRWS